MPRLLTVRKQKWIDKRKPEYLKGKPLNPSASAEIRYYLALEQRINKMCDDVEKRLHRALSSEAGQEFFAEDVSISSHTRIVVNVLQKKYDEIFGDLAKPLAESVVGEAEKTSSTAVHASLKELSGGLSLGTRVISPDLREVIKASITENVGLIKSIPEQYLSGVRGAVMRSITTGNGLQDLVPYLKKHRGVTLRRARFIAKDQHAKVFSSISREKMKSLGVKKFRWIHSRGGHHPRPLHKDVLDGQIFSFASPPVIDTKTGEKGFPGQLPGCKCRQGIVIDFSEE